MQSPAFDVVTQSQFIRAGAGAGKTTKLITTFMEFVKEFKLRSGRYPRVVMTTFTRKATQEVKERLLVTALTAGEKEIFEYINRKSMVHISTIHGLLSIYLSQFAERMKFPQEITIIDDTRYEKTLKKKINELCRQEARYLDLLEQYSFAQLVELASLALNHRAQNRHFSYVTEAELTALANQKKSALIGDIEKVLSMVPAVPDAWATYFAFLKALSKSGSDFLEVAQSEPPKPRWSNAKPPFDPLAHAIIEDLREKLEDPFSGTAYILRHQKLNALFFDFTEELFARMNAHKQNTGEFTIADLENLSLQLLEQHPDTAVEFSNSWDYFMIDEYQDTSPLQVRLLNQIVQNKPCFIVGDPQQSIYLFRGARSEVFEEKMQEMESKKAQLQFLETNYRSEPSLMNFINSFFAAFSPQFKPMLTKTETGKKTQPYDAYYIKSEDQTSGALNQIQNLISTGVNPQDICVLSRSNKKLTELAVRAAALKVPVQLQASAGFEEKREILDLLTFNKFLNNPHDDENLVALLRSPWFYLSDQNLLQLAQTKSQSLWIALRASSFPQKEELLKYSRLFDTVGCLQATKIFISEKSFITCSEIYDLTGKREANIFKFLILLAQAESQVGFSLGLFLEEQFSSLQTDLSSSSSEAQPVLQPNCVSLMTIHASKGLQFRHVILTGFTDKPQVSTSQRLTFEESTGKFSLQVMNEESGKLTSSDWAGAVLEKFNKRELLENERLLYVAMTRAIESLSLVAETDKKSISDKSWYKKTIWPEEGEHAENGFRIYSLVDDTVAEPAIADEKQAVTVRKKFSEPVETDKASSSVTELISSQAVALAAPDYPQTLVNLKKAQRGSDLHRVFEALKYIGADTVLKNLPSVDQTAVRYLLEQKELDMPEILKHGHNEWGFGLKTKGAVIQGQIDLWCELADEIHVLDYKTGSSAYSEKAFEQLSFYTLALLAMKQISPDKKITHSVIYPLEQTIKKKSFSDEKDFRKTTNQKILELFS